MMTALTGFTYSADDFIKTGERIWNLERLFNLKSGLTAKDDTLPPRLLNEPIPTGPSKGWSAGCPKCCPHTTTCAAGATTAYRPRRNCTTWR